ncbi:MAG: transcription antitermination factor NusB [Mariprofundaceae bacterium]
MAASSPPVGKGASTRKIAIDCLHSVVCERHRADARLDELFALHALPDIDRGFIHEVVYGALRRFYSLEADMSRFLRDKPADWLRMALIIGAYQLRHMRVPAHAAVGETVGAVKDSPLNFASGMVNAVLRRISRTPPPAKLKSHQRAELPKWLYPRWRDAFGPETVQDFCRQAQTPPPLTLALLTEDREGWIRRASDQGLEAKEGHLSPRALLLSGAGDVRRLPGFEEGEFVVMDQAAQVAAEIISGFDGLIADICAAPGGKTAVLARGNRQARISAVELRATRLPRLLQNLQRARAENVSVLQADGASLPMASDSMDAVLLDAPCSASGVLRRHPDAKFLHDERDIARHAALQKVLLAESLRVLKPGGRLVYAVCSIHVEENEQVVGDMPGWEAEALPDVLKPFQVADGMARLLPAAEHDGFFVAHMRKH